MVRKVKGLFLTMGGSGSGRRGWWQKATVEIIDSNSKRKRVRASLQQIYAFIEEMAGLQAEREEIAWAIKSHFQLQDVPFHVIEEFLMDDEEARDRRKSGEARQKISLRRAQFEKALKEKNTQMLIWLGKTYLGQKESTSSSTHKQTSFDEIKRLQKEAAQKLSSLIETYSMKNK